MYKNQKTTKVCNTACACDFIKNWYGIFVLTLILRLKLCHSFAYIVLLERYRFADDVYAYNATGDRKHVFYIHSHANFQPTIWRNVSFFIFHCF